MGSGSSPATSSGHHPRHASSAPPQGPAEPQDSNLKAHMKGRHLVMMSLGSASPRRSRFFGFRNLSSAWQSRDSMAPSGSMIDMQ